MDQKKRICKCCKQEKEMWEFHFSRVKRMTKKKGLVEGLYPNSFCIPCHNERNRANKEKRREEVLQYHKDYWKNYQRKPKGHKRENAITEEEKEKSWNSIKVRNKNI